MRVRESGKCPYAIGSGADEESRQLSCMSIPPARLSLSINSGTSGVTTEKREERTPSRRMAGESDYPAAEKSQTVNRLVLFRKDSSALRSPSTFRIDLNFKTRRDSNGDRQTCLTASQRVTSLTLGPNKQHASPSFEHDTRESQNGRAFSLA